MGASDALPKAKHLALYTLVCSVYLLTASGRLGSSDALAMFNVTQSLATNGSFRADPCEPGPKSNDCVPGLDGAHYAGFGLAPSVMAVPAYALGAATASVLHKDTHTQADLAVSLYRTMIAAAIPLVLCLWLCRIGLSPQAAVLGALLYAFASPAWINSKTYHSETYFNLALVGCCYFLASRSDRIRSLLAAGACFGFACACRIHGVILTPPLLVYALLVWRSRQSTAGEIVRNAVLAGIPFAFFISLIALSNEMRFGSVFLTGYHLAFPSAGALLAHPLLSGMWQLLFDPEFGLVVYAPWVLAIPLVWRRFWNRFRNEAVLVLSMFAVEYFFFSKYTALHGGSSTGPRMLDSVLPFLVVPLAALFDDVRVRAAARTVRAVVVLVGVALLIQIALAPTAEPRYYLMKDFNQAHGLHPWWQGQPILASIDALPGLFSAPPSSGVCPACDYLLTYPNSVNLVRADFWLYKASLLGVPRPIAAFAAILLAFLCYRGAKSLLSMGQAGQLSRSSES